MFYIIQKTSEGSTLWTADPLTHAPLAPVKACHDRREAFRDMRRRLRRARNRRIDS